MDITPPLRTRGYLPSLDELADHWREWGYRDDQHHCVLVAFFESWKALKENIGRGQYYCLAKVFDEHYRQAVFPAEGGFVYWLSGERRTPRTATSIAGRNSMRDISHSLGRCSM
jgi:hypothetical protein